MENRYRFRFWLEAEQKWFYFGFETFLIYQKQICKALDDGLKIYQCTGLKDKNGKLIYEEDIVENPLGYKHLIEWFKDGFWINGFINGAEWELRNLHKSYEVIGNIYENKDLLED